ncbi:hypothetical protein B0H68_005275, partial [Clostridium beijerinckii]|nr:hypothetical protein [Clostridium beijerinckii]
SYWDTDNEAISSEDGTKDKRKVTLGQR